MPNNTKISKKSVTRKSAKTVTPVAAAVAKEQAVRKAAKPRVVSFETIKKGKVRTFRPVNKRAKAFAALAGADTLSAKHLKAIKALKFRVVETGTLEVISL